VAWRSSLRGRPRFTHDADFLLEVPQIVLPGLLDELVERGFAIDPTVVIKQFVREHVASFPFGRVRIDWLKLVLPLYSRTLADASPLEWTVLTANRDDIDVDLIRQEWSPFAATEAERTSWLEAVIARRVVRRE
jgi:hypothetical protein